MKATMLFVVVLASLVFVGQARAQTGDLGTAATDAAKQRAQQAGQNAVSGAMGSMGLAPAAGDPNDVGMAHSEAFAKSCAAGDIPGVLALYEDDATVIWPNQGDVAHGKVEIEKLARALCKSGQPGPKLKSQNSKQVAPDYIVNVGMWDATATGPDGKPVTSEVRTTEVIHLTNGKWLYTVDHASIGMPPTPLAAAAPPPAPADAGAAPSPAAAN